MARAKVFGIGFHKTGTTSLAAALRILGYDTIHGDPINEPPYGDEGRSLIARIDKGNFRLPTIEHYDAFTDNPYFSIWKELDKAYPGSQFILTIREEEQWINSCVKYYKGRRRRPMRIWMFGGHADPSVSEAAQQHWRSTYRQHNHSILEYFKDRPQDLLVLDITKGEGWSKLCPFLGQTIPEVAFPRENVFASYSTRERLIRKLRHWKVRFRKW
ncbi:MAG: sulfotransferase family protein [Bacteroidota bacterium]